MTPGRPAGRVVVVGLGPGDPGLVTVAARDAIARIAARHVRTTRHPSAGLVGAARSFDDLYEAAGSVEEVYAAIVDELAAAAGRHGEVLYAVPGSPLVAERAVELLRTDGRCEVEVLPALSFLDLAWARLGVDPVAVGARLVDGHRFAEGAAGERGPLLVAQADTRLVLSEVKLALSEVVGAGDVEVVVLQRLGLPDESVRGVPWPELDREVEPDHLTCLWVPALAAPVAAEVAALDEVVHTLRARCPWDMRQTHGSLTRHLLEEAHEVVDAIDELERTGSHDHLEEELGDLLFQVALHSTLAAEAGAFTLADVARGIHDKLVRRHPHVFAGAATANWEQLKAAEKGYSSVMDGMPENLPSLLYAHKVQRKAASIGFDWQSAAGAWPKIGEELDELRAAMAGGGDGSAEVNEELGDVLFAVVNVARHLDVDPEAALRAATAKFRRRFAVVEAAAGGEALSLDALDRLWDEAKRQVG